jgi:hypothetical protein
MGITQSVIDCTAPIQVSINFTFGDTLNPPTPGNWCADLEVSDALPLFSNKIENVCVTVP